MTPWLPLLLGGMTLFAGLWAISYAVARLAGSRAALITGSAFYVGHAICGIAAVSLGELSLGWSLLVLFALPATLALPPFAWRLLESLHEHGEEPHHVE